MKGLIVALVMLLPVAGIGQTRQEKIQRKIDGVTAEYKYPTDSITRRINYQKEVTVANTSKATLYKRAKQFLALQQFGRIENIKCRNGSTINIQLVDDKPFIDDAEDGKLMGNGFFPWNYALGGMQRYYIVFKYKIIVADNSYKYQFTDFKMLEFLSAPKERGRAGGYVSSFGYGGFATGSTTKTHSDAAVFQEDLEKFILRGIYQDKDLGHDKFTAQRKKMISDLRQVMLGEL